MIGLCLYFQSQWFGPDWLHPPGLKSGHLTEAWPLSLFHPSGRRDWCKDGQVTQVGPMRICSWRLQGKRISSFSGIAHLVGFKPGDLVVIFAWSFFFLILIILIASFNQWCEPLNSLFFFCLHWFKLVSVTYNPKDQIIKRLFAYSFN